MQIPLEIEFRHLDRSDAIEAAIREKVAKLDRFAGELTGCRVTVDAPHRHQHQGRQYEVHIRLLVPGTVISVSHDHQDKHHDDPYIAIGDAFDVARRRLEDYVRVRRGDVKTHPVQTPPPG